MVRFASVMILSGMLAVTVTEAAGQASQIYTREAIEAQRPERLGTPTDQDATIAVPEAPQTPVPEGGPQFQLNGLAMEGSSVYDAARLDALMADLIGKPIDFAGLRAVTDRIERLYRTDGYLAVRAVIPAQRIADGVVRVVIVEGKVSALELRGDLGRSEPEVRRLLEKLVGQQPLQVSFAERQLLLARDLPGISLLAALRPKPSDVPGELVLLVEGALTPLDGFVSLSNFASEFAGPYVFTAGGGVNSVLFAGDRLEAIALTALDVGEELLGQIAYEAPLGIDGMRFRIEGSNAVSETGAELTPLDIDYRSQTLRASIGYDVIRSRSRTATIGGGLEAIHQESNSLIPAIEIDEDLRVLFGEARLIENNVLGGRLDASTELRFGLDILGANSEGDPNLTGPIDTDPQFVSAQFDFDYLRPLPAGFAMRARVQSQVSSGDLPTYERFSLGNYTIGRGFDPGALAGDHGVGLSLTLSYALDLPQVPFVASPEAFGFFDTGRVWLDGENRGLSSVGLGARWQMFEQIDAEVFVAVPVDDSDVIDSDDVSGLFRVTTFF
ncbi:MAG: ShlB/FhaC/HecB family hemolysin secretion/activation protein [Pseudomonadota bacterium]